MKYSYRYYRFDRDLKRCFLEFSKKIVKETKNFEIFENWWNLHDYLPRKSPAVVAQFAILSSCFLQPFLEVWLYIRCVQLAGMNNWFLIVTSLDLLTIRFRPLKLKLSRWNLNRIRIRLLIHRSLLSSRVNYNIFLFYLNACLFDDKKKKRKSKNWYHRYCIKGLV